MRNKKAKKKGMNPVVAVLMLLAGMGVVGKNLLGGSVGALVPATSGGGDANAVVSDPAADGSTGEKPAEHVVKWRDLLAEFGSFRRGDEVRSAFVAFEYPSSWTGPAVAGEAPAVRWEGDDPPMLRLGVVMVSAAARRAVLGGKVVGIGDAIDDGKVVAIDPGVVVVSWRGKRLT